MYECYITVPGIDKSAGPEKKRNKQKVIQNSHGIVRQEHFFGFLFFSRNRSSRFYITMT